MKAETVPDLGSGPILSGAEIRVASAAPVR